METEMMLTRTDTGLSLWTPAYTVEETLTAHDDFADLTQQL